jgi:cytochrome c1
MSNEVLPLDDQNGLWFLKKQADGLFVLDRPDRFVPLDRARDRISKPSVKWPAGARARGGALAPAAVAQARQAACVRQTVGHGFAFPPPHGPLSPRLEQCGCSLRRR